MKKNLIISTTRSEGIGGWVFLVFHLLFAPILLQLINRILPKPLSAVMMNFLYFVVSFSIAVLLFRKFLRKSWAMAKLYPGYTLQSAALGFVAYQIGNYLIAILFAKLLPDFQNVNDSTISILAEDNYALMAIGSVFLVPVTEELLYRGLLFQGFYRKSRVLAYALSTTAFSLIHIVGYIGIYEPKLLFLCFLQYIPAGLSLAWAYARSNTIFAPILMHMTINAMGITSMR